MKKLESIEIIFENCEVAEVAASDIHSISLANVSTNISGLTEGTVMELRTCNSLSLVLNKEANKYYYPFDIKDDMGNMLFARINDYKDITAVNLKYADNTEEMIYVKWSEFSDYSNPYQHSIIKDEKLILTIREN